MLNKIISKSFRNKLFHPVREAIRNELERRLERFLTNDILRNRRFLEKLQAKLDCVAIEGELFGNAPTFRKRPEILALAAELAKKNRPDGLWLEFGVYKGKTITFLASLTSGPVYGFDSFEGLPDEWVQGHYRVAPKGKRDLGSVLPPVPDNVTLIKGWFKDTIPPFLAKHTGPVALLHVDSDLYSSAKCILESVPIDDQTVIVFDEYFNYPAWRQGEYKAFQEFLSRTNRTAECIGYCNNSNQAAFITKLNKIPADLSPAHT